MRPGPGTVRGDTAHRLMYRLADGRLALQQGTSRFEHRRIPDLSRKRRVGVEPRTTCTCYISRPCYGACSGAPTQTRRSCPEPPKLPAFHGPTAVTHSKPPSGPFLASALISSDNSMRCIFVVPVFPCRLQLPQSSNASALAARGRHTGNRVQHPVDTQSHAVEGSPAVLGTVAHAAQS